MPFLFARDDHTGPPIDATHPPAEPGASPPHVATHPTEAKGYAAGSSPPHVATHPTEAQGYVSSSKGLGPGAIAGIVLVVLLLLLVVAYIVYVFLRARKLGLPTPTLKSFIPNRRTGGTAYEPSRGGMFGFLKSNKGYDGRHERGMRLREQDGGAWDHEVGRDDDLEYRGAAADIGRGRYDDPTGAKAYEERRGRSRSRDERRRPSVESERRSVFREGI